MNNKKHLKDLYTFLPALTEYFEIKSKLDFLTELMNTQIIQGENIKKLASEYRQKLQEMRGNNSNSSYQNRSNLFTAEDIEKMDGIHTYLQILFDYKYHLDNENDEYRIIDSLKNKYINKKGNE